MSNPRQRFTASDFGMLEYSGDNIACAREILNKVDYPRLIASSKSQDFQGVMSQEALITAVSYCHADAPEGYENYHNDKVAVAHLTHGIPSSGAVDYTGDIDVFSYTAEEGKIYQVFVEAGSLQSPLAERFDSTFRFSDNYFTEEGSDIVWPIICHLTSETQEFPMEWQAAISGDALIVVWGGSCDDLGTYTVTLSVSEGAVDD